MKNQATPPIPEVSTPEADELTTTLVEQEAVSDEGIVRNIDELKELIEENHPDIKLEDLSPEDLEDLP